MLQAYIDESGAGDPNELILAGYVASAETWQKFSQQWKSRLDEAHLSRFKMSEMSRQMEFAGWFYKLIDENDILAAVSVVVDTAGLIKVVREIVPPASIEAERLENPYFWGFRAIVEGLTALRGKVGIYQPIDFIFDEKSEKTRILAIWDWLQIFMHPSIRGQIASTPIFRDDESFMPLQAADLYAWWVRKWHRERIRDDKFPWPTNRQISRLRMWLGEPELRTMFKRTAERLPQLAQEMKRIDDPKAYLEGLKKCENGVPMSWPDPSSQWRY